MTRQRKYIKDPSEVMAGQHDEHIEHFSIVGIPGSKPVIDPASKEDKAPEQLSSEGKERRCP